MFLNIICINGLGLFNGCYAIVENSYGCNFMMTKPNPVDIQVGSRLRQRRALLGMTQQHLATALNLSFQQIQKYESGINRISAGRLYHFSQLLNVPIGYFFEGAKQKSGAAADDTLGALQSGGQTKRETLELARAFSHISDSTVRKRLLEVARAMAMFSPSA